MYLSLIRIESFMKKKYTYFFYPVTCLFRNSCISCRDMYMELPLYDLSSCFMYDGTSITEA